MKNFVYFIALSALLLVALSSCSPKKVETYEPSLMLSGVDIFRYENFFCADNLDNATIRPWWNKKFVDIKNVSIGGDERRCLRFFPSEIDSHDREVVFKNIEISGVSRLRFGIGIDPESRKSDAKEVVFEVFVISEKEKNMIFQHTIETKGEVGSESWSDFEVPLSSFAGKIVDISFSTKFIGKESADCECYFSEPVVYNLPFEKSWPNIIFISIDSLRADHLGCYGYIRDTSPNIDDFSRDCVLYRYSISQANWTLPSYASMFTALNPNKHLAGTLNRLRTRHITIAEVLSRLGYNTTSYNGGGYIDKSFGMDQGFSEYNSFPEKTTKNKDIRWVVPESKKWIEKNSNKGKFFLFIHTYEVHHPYNPPDEFKNMYETHKGDLSKFYRNLELFNGDLLGYIGFYEIKKLSLYKEIPEAHKKRFINLYDAGINHTDIWLGEFFTFLKDEGLYDESLIILNADHGQEFYDHIGWTHGHTVYSEVINVPMMIKYPEGKKQGIEKERISRSIDIAPTILEDFLGLHIENSPFDGRPLSKSLDDDDRTLSFCGSPKKIAVFRGDIKYICNFKKYNEAEPDLPREELYLFRKDFADKKMLTTDIVEDLPYFRNIVEKEGSLFGKKGEEEVTSEINDDLKERLKDLGYVQ